MYPNCMIPFLCMLLDNVALRLGRRGHSPGLRSCHTPPPWRFPRTKQTHLSETSVSLPGFKLNFRFPEFPREIPNSFQGMQGVLPDLEWTRGMSRVAENAYKDWSWKWTQSPHQWGLYQNGNQTGTHLGQELIPPTALLLEAQGSARNQNSNLAFQDILKIASVKVGG